MACCHDGSVVNAAGIKARTVDSFLNRMEPQLGDERTQTTQAGSPRGAGERTLTCPTATDKAAHRCPVAARWSNRM